MDKHEGRRPSSSAAPLGTTECSGDPTSGYVSVQVDAPRYGGPSWASQSHSTTSTNVGTSRTGHSTPWLSSLVMLDNRGVTTTTPRCTRASPHRHRTATAPSPHRHRTVTALSPHCHRAVTSRHRGVVVVTPRLFNIPIATRTHTCNLSIGAHAVQLGHSCYHYVAATTRQLQAAGSPSLTSYLRTFPSQSPDPCLRH